MLKVKESNSFYQSLTRNIERLGSLFEGIAALLVLSVTALITYEVVARYFFNNPTGFANQFSAYAMPLIAFLAAGAALKKNEHVAVDIFINKLNSSNNKRLTVINELVSVVVIGYVLYAAATEVFYNYVDGIRSFSTVITFPEYIPQIVMLVGIFVLLLMQFLKLTQSVIEIVNS